MRYNATTAHVPISRKRKALYEHEPVEGKVLIWRVMGFGGKGFPLVFARVSGVVIRLTQASVQFCHPELNGLMGQTYVDDPAFTSCGSRAATEFATNAIFLLWLLLGINLSWS